MYIFVPCETRFLLHCASGGGVRWRWRGAGWLAASASGRIGRQSSNKVAKTTATTTDSRSERAHTQQVANAGASCSSSLSNPQVANEAWHPPATPIKVSSEGVRCKRSVLLPQLQIQVLKLFGVNVVVVPGDGTGRAAKRHVIKASVACTFNRIHPRIVHHKVFLPPHEDVARAVLVEDVTGLCEFERLRFESREF